ncbi:MAG: flippase-like domain-containing protein [Thermoanaerobaculia bacterium]|nr:flippase-like domain-containing protein [Thermoanaerobaculia bacterium]
MAARNRTLRVAVSLGLAALLLVLFLRTLDFAAVGRAIAAAHVGWLLLATACGLVATPLFRSWRWGLLLKKAGHPSFLQLNSATSIGFAASTLLPARAGEIVRPVALAKNAGLPVAPCLASIALERLIDLVTVIGLFVAYAVGWAPTGMGGEESGRFELLRRSAFLLGSGTLVGLAFLGFLAAKPARVDRLVSPFLRFLPDRIGAKIESILHSFLDGLGTLGTVRDVLVVGAASVLLWMLISFQIWSTMRAFDLDFPFPVTYFVLTWAVLGLAIPTPGGVGGYHAAVAYALTGFYGVSKDTAGAFALVSHALSFVPITLIGLVFLVAGGFSLKSLAAEREPSSSPSPTPPD